MKLADISRRIRQATVLGELLTLSSEIGEAAFRRTLEDLAQANIGQIKLDIHSRARELQAAAKQVVDQQFAQIERNTTDAVISVRRNLDAMTATAATVRQEPAASL